MGKNSTTLSCPVTIPIGSDVIDIDVLKQWQVTWKKKLSLNRVMPSHCSIFKIPTILSRHIEKAYVPNAFSIGPFHHEKPNLKPTNRIKQKYLLDLISRLSNPNHPITSDPKLIRNFTEVIKSVQNEDREYYAGPIDMETNEFVEMLVLDGCFIIELFRKTAYPVLRDGKDPRFITMSCILQFLYHDLILMLENQIPWLVLSILFDLTKTASIDKKPLVQLATEFFPSLLKKKSFPVQIILSAIQNQENKHILDLFRNSLIFTSDILGKRSINDWQQIHSATVLLDSGITFKAEIVPDSILDIKFCPKSGSMSMAALLIQETTETVFRNLISLEQCCPNYKPIITCYAVLLDNPIDTNDDIQVLDKSKVIINWLNIDDATKFFNKLYIDTFVKENYYYQLTSEVNKYCEGHWPKYRRVLKRDYFKHR